MSLFDHRLNLNCQRRKESDDLVIVPDPPDNYNYNYTLDHLELEENDVSDRKVTKNKFFWKTLYVITWRVLCGLLGLFFLSATILQINDPDPYLWIPAYGITWFISWTLMIYPTVGFSKHKEIFSLGITQSSSRTTTWELILGSSSPLNIIISLQIFYNLSLGLWTLWIIILTNENQAWREIILSSSSDSTRMKLFKDGLNNETQNFLMFAEEVKELLGLCINIAWLYLIKDSNFTQVINKWKLFIGFGIATLPFIIWIQLEALEESMKNSC